VVTAEPVSGTTAVHDVWCSMRRNTCLLLIATIRGTMMYSAPVVVEQKRSILFPVKVELRF
jgi:hypothetical protein